MPEKAAAVSITEVNEKTGGNLARGTARMVERLLSAPGGRELLERKKQELREAGIL